MSRAGDFLNHFLFHVVVFFNRISSFFQHSQSLHTARFAQLHELTELLTERFDETSLLLGVHYLILTGETRPDPSWLSAYSVQRHD